MFTPEDIQSRMRGRPFIPVRIVTSTGETYDIYHPDLVMAGRRAIMIGLPSADNPSVFEQVTRVAMVHVAELRLAEFIDASQWQFEGRILRS